MTGFDFIEMFLISTIILFLAMRSLIVLRPFIVNDAKSHCVMPPLLKAAPHGGLWSHEL